MTRRGCGRTKIVISLHDMAPMQTTLDDVQLLHALADVAAAAIVPRFRRLPDVENKAASGFDPVTVADRAAEEAMRELIASERPDDAIVGEEFPERKGRSGRTWILDPIDGTRAFMMGLPTWGTLVALADEQGPFCGMMCQPVVSERFWTTGTGAFHAGYAQEESRISARRCRDLSRSVIATTSPRSFPAPLRARFEALCDEARMVRYGTDCYAYALLAAGHVDVVVEVGLKPVDIAPFVPMVAAAGGAIVDLSGAPIGRRVLDNYHGEAVAVGDPALLPAVLTRLSG